MERRSERIFGQRYGCRPVRISDLNLHLMCVLCSGYYIDATTIIECLHSFCRSCIVRYLETSSRCPICDVLVHKAQPLLNIRVDHVLQGLVYKLVPGLLTKEMNSRREFYSHGLASRQRDQNQEGHSTKTQSVSVGEESQQRYVRTPSLSPTDSESLSISLEYLPSSKVTMESRAQDAESRVGESAIDSTDLPSNEYADIRYLLCPAGFTVGGLKKFIRAKFDLPLVYQIDIFHGDECLENHFSMLDVAFIFQWQKKAPLHLRYSVSYVPRTKRKLTTSSNSTRRQNSKENETQQSGSNTNGDENGTTSSQQELTLSHPSLCPSKTSKHMNSRTRPVGDDKKSTVCKDNGTPGAKRVGRGVIRDGKSAMSSSRGGGGSGHQDAEEGAQPMKNARTSTTKNDGVLSGLTSRGSTVSKGGPKKTRDKSNERNTEFQDHGKQTREESGQLQTTSTPRNIVEHENIVYGTSENSELTIDLTGDDMSYSVTTQVNDTSRGDIASGITTSESVNRVVGSVTFVGNGSAAMLSNHKSVLCNVNSGDIAKPTIALPCINAFKTLSCGGLHNHLGYASSSDANHVIGDSVVTDDVVKIMSSPEVSIVPSFGIQLIYSPDALSASHNPPICGMIQLPEAPVPVTSDAPVRAPTWGHSDVATNGIMNDADFQRLCEGKSIHAAEKSFGGCFEHFVMPNLAESGVKMSSSDEMALGYTVALESPASGPLPCVFVSGHHHQPQNSWGLLPESGKDEAETVDWGVCYPITATELGTASLTSVSDVEEQPGCSFVCVAASNALPGSTTARPAELWYADRNGAVETQPTLGGSTWQVESRQCEPRAVKMCIVEPQAVKRKAEDDWAVGPKEARTSFAESIAVNAELRTTVEIRAEGNRIVEEPQAVGTQTMGATRAVESMPELWAVEPRTMEPVPVEPRTMEPVPVEPRTMEPVTVEPRTMEPVPVEPRTMEPVPVEPKAMGSRAVERKSMKAVTVGLRAVEVQTMSSSCVVESSLVETLLGVETEQRQSLLVKEPIAVRSATVVLQAGESQTVAAWVAEESLVEPDDVEPPMATASPSTLEQSLVEQNDLDPMTAARTFTVGQSLVEPDDVEPVAAAAKIFTLDQSLVEPDEVEPDDVEPDYVEPVTAAAKTFVLENLKSAERICTGVAYATPDVQSHDEDEPRTVCPSFLPVTDSDLTVVSEETARLDHQEETSTLDQSPGEPGDGKLAAKTSTLEQSVVEQNDLEPYSILQQNLDHSFLTTVSEVSGCQRETDRISQNWEETDTFHQNQRMLVADNSADYNVENAISRNDSAKQVHELHAEEKRLFSGDDLTEKYDETSTDSVCSKEDKQSISADIEKKDLNFDSVVDLKVAVDNATVVLVKTEDTPVSEYLEESLSVEIEAVRVSTKPENISCKVEDESVLLDGERLVEENTVSAKVEDLPAPAEDVDNVHCVAVDTQSTSCSHLSNSMVLPPSSETMFCSPETTELLVSVEDIPVSSGSVYHCPVSAEDIPVSSSSVYHSPVSTEDIPVSSSSVYHSPVSTGAENIPVSGTLVNHCTVSTVAEDIPVSSTFVNHCPVSTGAEDIPVSGTFINHCPVSAVAEDMPVSSTSAVYYCPVSPVETGVLLADNGMLVSVMHDHVMVCIRDEEPFSVAEEEEDNSDEVTQTESAAEMPVSDDEIRVSDVPEQMPVSDITEEISVSDVPEELQVSDVPEELQVSDVPEELQVSDVLQEILVSDVPEEIPVSDVPEEIPISGGPEEIPISDVPEELPVSDVPEEILVSDVPENIPVSDGPENVSVSDVSEEISVYNGPENVPVSDVPENITVSDVFENIPVSDEGLRENIPVSDVPQGIPFSDTPEEIPVSDVPDEIPVSDVTDKSQLINSSSDELPLFVPIPSIPIKHSVLTEDAPVSPPPSLETLPVCSHSLETTPFRTSTPVDSIVYPLAISSPAGGCSDLVARDFASENQVMSTSEELDDDDLSLFISTSDSEVSEVVPVLEEYPAVGDINSEVSEVVPVSEEYPAVGDINSEVSEVVPASEEYPAVGGINSEVSEVVLVSEEYPAVGDINSDVSEVVPVSEEYSVAGDINLEVSEVVPLSEESPAVGDINSEVSEVVPVSEEYSAVSDINSEVSEVVPVPEDYPAVGDINSEVSEVVPVSEQHSAVGDINLSAVEVCSNDGGIEDRSSERLDCTEEVEMMNSVEESLVTDDDVLRSSFPLDFGDGESTGGGSDQNVGLHDMEDLGTQQVPGCEAEMIGALVVTDNDQKPLENRVDLLPSGDSVSTCVEEREEYVDREEDGVALSQRLLCSGSFIPGNEDGDKDGALSQRLLYPGSFIHENEDGDKEEDGAALSQRLLFSGSLIPGNEDGDKEGDCVALSQRPLCSGSIDEDENHDSFRSIVSVSRSLSFSNTPQGGSLDCAVPSGSQRRRSRSLDESANQKLQSSGVQSSDCIVLNEKTESPNRRQDTDELLDESVCGQNTDELLDGSVCGQNTDELVGGSVCGLDTDELLSGSVCSNQSVARGGARSLPDEPIFLNRGESFMRDVPVSSFQNQPFITVTKMQDDTNAVVVSPVNDVLSVDDERAETCKFVAMDTIDFCDASGNDLKSKDCGEEYR